MEQLFALDVLIARKNIAKFITFTGKENINKVSEEELANTLSGNFLQPCRRDCFISCNFCFRVMSIVSVAWEFLQCLNYLQALIIRNADGVID